ncbi:hypothetical protein ABB34_13285 [Stenotrophomonas daejeonensis]|uniref:Type IV secretion protein Rhs n=1 Tax=Stenotrophomonas daejeonensis TaxID=659018 RepID=A0A0R0DWC0_9GAMM|nr:hypothetical protein ABB34_13285 [Stenotrophomonas daejeonensis]
MAKVIQTKEQDTCEGQEVTSQPVIIATGNKIKPEADFTAGQGKTGVGVLRLYDKAVVKSGIFGARWASNLEYSLTFAYGSVQCAGKLDAATTCSPGANALSNIYAYRASGYGIEFSKDAAGIWKDSKGNVLAKSGANWVLTNEDGSKDTYDSQGRPLSIVDERGIGTTYTYTNNRLATITHTTGKTLSFTWSGSRVSRITDPAGKAYVYAYNSAGYLASVTYPDSLGVRGYLYEDAKQPGGLTGITINGVRYSKYSYYADGRVKSSGLGANGDIDRSSFVYATDHVNVTNALGQVVRHEIAEINGSKRVIGVERPASPVCPAGGKYTAYLASGNIDYQIDALGIKTDYSYDADDRLTRKITGIGPNGETDQRQITDYLWDATHKGRLLAIKVYGTSTSQKLSETTYAYYPDGDARARLLQSVTVKNLTGNGVANATQVTGYAYTLRANKLIATMTVDGPAAGTGDAVTYGYDTAGNLTSVKNSLNHTTTYGSYTALGLPGKVTGANGDVVDYTYDAMGRMTLQRTYLNGGSQNYRYEYDAAGNLIRESRPDGGGRQYFYLAYNPAWPTVISMSTTVAEEQRKIFTRNALGLVTGETLQSGRLIPAPSSIFCRKYPLDESCLFAEELEWSYTDVAKIFMDYDAGGFLQAVRGNNGQNIRYTYDANGNVVTVKDALNRTTTLSYDRQQNLVQSKDPLGKLTKYEYDRIGRLTKVTDPRGKATSYVYDGFGQLWSQTSPDTGTTTFEYDSGGRTTRMTRANGVATTYTHDALGRPTSITAGGQVQTFAWDTCSNGKGRLCGVADSKGELTYTYTPQGQLLTQGQKIGTSTVNFGQSYAYDNLGQLTGISYPGGVSVGYGYLLGQVQAMTVKIGSTTHNVATQLRHEPFGPLSSWTYGNGLMRTASFDMDGRLTALSTRNGAAYSQKLDYQYTTANEISRITNAAITPLTQSYGYDALSRLTTVTASGANQSFAWDANGNRTSHVWGGQTDLYATASGSNRLTGITGPRATSYTYDANGNTLSGEGATYTYSPFNRLSGVTKGGKTQEYWINPLGQRTLKRQTGVLDTQLGFVYGPSGQVEVEYAWGDSNANRRWTHYLRLPNGEPVAMVRNKQLYMIHTDHLGRPELATNSAKAVVWRANNYAFDRTVTLDSIGGLNLGFPGQYHDVETGLAYNYFRTYNPRTGRYLESDPIGLAGGINTYAYVGGSPVVWTDSHGLAGDPLAGYKPIYGPIITKTPTTPIHWAEKFVSGLIIGKISFGSTGVNKYGQLTPKASSLLGRASVFIALMEPVEVGCAELDCDKNGISDYLDRDPNICPAPGAGMPQQMGDQYGL